MSKQKRSLWGWMAIIAGVFFISMGSIELFDANSNQQSTLWRLFSLVFEATTAHTVAGIAYVVIGVSLINHGVKKAQPKLE